MANQPSQVYKSKVGNIEINAVFDGGWDFGHELLVGATDSEIIAQKSAHFIDSDTIPAVINTFLVKNAGKNILIDTGARGYAPDTGHFIDNLGVLGVKPSDIDEIYITHAHPDHISGLINASGAPIFPNIPVCISSLELDFWFNDQIMEQLNGGGGAFKMARDALTPYKNSGQINTFELGADLGNGATSIDLRGHTLGHSGFRFSDGNQQIIIWGDIVHMQSMQFAHPEWSLTFDADKDAAIASRKRIMDEVATDRIRVAGMHLALPAMGHVVKRGNAYEYVTQVWERDI